MGYWQVAQPHVTIRGARNMFAEIVGHKDKCDVVSGTSAHGWVKLDDGSHRYMLEAATGVELLTRIEFAWLTGPGQDCGSMGFYPIGSTDMCQAAALSMGLHAQVVNAKGHTDAPAEGCWVMPQFQPVMSFGGGESSGDTGAQPLCTSAEPCKPLESTTPIKTTTPKTTRPVPVTTTTSTKATTKASSSLHTTSTTPRSDWQKNSMFCFLMAQVDGGYERDLIENAKQRGLSIYNDGCDEHLTITDVKIEICGMGKCEMTAPIGSFACEKGEWGSWANAEVFLRGWRALDDDARYRQHDWTVKVDADTVFYPDRFPLHMDTLKLSADAPVFLKNFMPGYPVVGALEAVSTIALTEFFDNHPNDCDDLAIGAAEDYWFWKCMERLGAQMIQDDMLLQHEGHPAGDKCMDGWFVAMHPYKSVDAYNGCIDKQGFDNA
jgi:hypothetical protein